MPDFPTSVRIGPHDWTVKLWDEQAAGNTQALGLCDKHTCTILIMEGMAPQKEAEVLMHEIIHAIYDVGGLRYLEHQEEAVVNAMGYHMVGIVRDNPDLMDYFAAAMRPTTVHLKAAPRGRRKG